MLLAFDPSSTAIGYAVSTSARVLVSAGVIRPERRTVPYLERLPDMLDEARALILEFLPQVIVIEMPGRHAKKAGGSTGASLAMYGTACGAIWQMARLLACWPPRNPMDESGPPLRDLLVVPVDSGKWSTVSKEARCLGVKAQFKQYRKSDDPGMDMSDAIALGQWWWQRDAMEQAAARIVKKPRQSNLQESR